MTIRDMAHFSSTYKPGDLVSTSYSFKKDRPEDLSFRRNEELQILDIARDPNWAHAANAFGETGLIPLNYVQPSVNHARQLKSHRWYHGRISRLESESVLSGYPPGSFLVRDSDLFSGDLTLCVVGPPLDHLCAPSERLLDSTDTTSTEPIRTTTTTNVQHYHIVCKPTIPAPPTRTPLAIHSTSPRYSLDEIDWFTNLPDLLQYYSVPDSGLVSPLCHPVPDIQRQRLDQLRELGWIIPRSELILGDQIGRGEFGEVLRATYKNADVAVKMYKKTACKLAVTYEAILMTKLDHPNLVAFVGFVYEPEEDAVFLITEYLAQGNLLTYLHSRTREEVTERDRLRFCLDACRGLAYLEERRIVHRDVAARNILLSGHPPLLIAKVADFGMARDLNHTDNDSPQLSSLVPPSSAPPGFLDVDTPPLIVTGSEQHSVLIGNPSRSDPDLSGILRDVSLHETAAVPIKWTAPEAVQKRLFTSKSDVWSFGILMWEIYSFGRIPYPRMMAGQALRQILAGYRMKAPDACPSDIYQLMRRTWCIAPDERPSFAQLLKELSTCMQRLDRVTSRVRRSFSGSRRSAEPEVAQRRTIPPHPPHKHGIRNSYTERIGGLSCDSNYDQLDDLVSIPPAPMPQCPVRYSPVPTVTTALISPGPPMSRSFTTAKDCLVQSVRPGSVEHAGKSFCLPKFERV